MRRGTTLGAVLLAGALALAPLAANAAQPDELESGHLTDASGVLSASEERDLEARLTALAEKRDRPELFVVFVDDFESPSDAAQWADRTAERNNLGDDQYLLAVATEGRALAISYDDAGPLSEDRVLEIEEGLGSGYLADDDWTGGVAYVAAEFDEVPLPWWVWALGIVAFAGLIYVITLVVKLSRRKAALALELRTLDGQRKRAAVTLVRADEALRTSEQELGFVTAEFGDEATAEFQAVLAEGRTALDRAFELQALLEDATEDTPSDTRKWTDEIRALCAQVDRSLNDRRRQLAELRGVAKDSAATLARLTKARAEAGELVAVADGRIAPLRATVAPERLAGIADDPDEMRERLAHADEWLARLKEAAARGRATAIVTAVREIERDLAEVRQLHTAVTTFAAAEAADASAAAGSPAAVADPAGGALPSFARTTLAVTGDRDIDRVAAALRVAENSVAARAGQLTAQTLAKLTAAQKSLELARTSPDPETKATHVRAALALADQVQVAAGVRSASWPDPARGGGYRRPLRTSAAASDDDGMGAKAGIGAVSGGAIGLFSGLGVASGQDGAAGAIVLFVLGGAVLGALSGAFGGGDGSSGSSSGWGGSSRSRSSFRSGSSRSSSGRSRSSGGGGRSSGGGRRF